MLDFRIRNWAGSLLMGVAVFVIWIAPDRFFPGYHSHWLFTNPVMGSVAATLPESSRGDWAVLTLRTLRAAVFVPIAEELFWRGWLMRWLISPHFEEVPLGAWSARAFWIVADPVRQRTRGFMGCRAWQPGIFYNWWMVRTRSLGDLILAHGITNASSARMWCLRAAGNTGDHCGGSGADASGFAYRTRDRPCRSRACGTDCRSARASL